MEPAPCISESLASKAIAYTRAPTFVLPSKGSIMSIFIGRMPNIVHCLMGCRQKNYGRWLGFPGASIKYSNGPNIISLFQ